MTFCIQSAGCSTERWTGRHTISQKCKKKQTKSRSLVQSRYRLTEDYEKQYSHNHMVCEQGGLWKTLLPLSHGL